MLLNKRFRQLKRELKDANDTADYYIKHSINLQVRIGRLERELELARHQPENPTPSAPQMQMRA